MPDLDIPGVVRALNAHGVRGNRRRRRPRPQPSAPRHPVENWAQYDTLHLMTKYGPLDIVFAPDGAPRGFDDLQVSADEHPVQAEDAPALVISVATWEQLKHASGRAKDLEHLDRFYEES